jgi:hypothetical protein
VAEHEHALQRADTASAATAAELAAATERLAERQLALEAAHAAVAEKDRKLSTLQVGRDTCSCSGDVHCGRRRKVSARHVSELLACVACCGCQYLTMAIASHAINQSIYQSINQSTSRPPPVL